ncbi:MULTISPECIES: tetratricopeptide repeat protein [unclassified Ectothiorhodospira]|uniref:tetratricopeptide repeat protein n=1 Tax=unclassified Ectothiorhodospira TaxID=2684909 RepID=UPI001EE9613F|nr:MULTISPECIES: tetratricopeptide repeat protein [unclassified Ectothiorhodospira]MCG5516653.1 tetratricopeptide repeat protein [Ectothiorhodospira sp. 9100]MCG5519571.1 tetratricopeptide repeat protein [Ectothiorhodospira sp. 9905]
MKPSATSFASFPARAAVVLAGAVLAASLLTACAGLAREGGGHEPDAYPDPDLRMGAPEDNGQADLIYELLVGEIAGHMGELQVSLDHYLRAAGRSDDPDVAERATRIALFSGDPDKVLPAAQRWVALDDNNLEARQVLAAMLVNDDQPEAAVPHLEWVLERMDAVEGDGLGLLVNVLSRAQNGAAAVNAMEQVVAGRAEDPEAHLALGRLALQQDQPHVAVTATERALRLAPDLREANVLRARAIQHTGDRAASLQAMDELVRRYPDDLDLRVNYGRLLLQEARFADARAQFEAVVSERGDDADMLYTLGLINIEMERYDDAEGYLEQVLRTGQRSGDARYYLARIAELTGDTQRAVDFYEEVDRGDYRQESVLRAARLQGELGQINQAREGLARLREASDEPHVQVETYLAEAQLLRDARDYRAGMMLLDEALAAHPGHPDLLYARALMAERLGRIAQLEDDLGRILARDPENFAALNALGYTLADRTDRLDEAFDYIRRALEQRPEDAAVIDSMGWVLYRLGRLGEAESHLRRAYEKMQDGEIASNLAQVLWDRGAREEALDILETALERDPDHERLLRLKEKLNP